MKTTTKPTSVTSLFAFVALAVAVMSALLGTFMPVADAGATGVDAATSGFYLDLGGSASVGVQPTLVDPHGQRTDEGYANDLVAYEASRGVTLDLTELGCSGESTATMINGFDRCYRARDSQLGEAMSFLRSHYHDEGVVTIDLGFNNVHRCMMGEVLDAACVDTQIGNVRQQLPTILEGLESVAGPGVTIVGLSHYNPFLADVLRGPTGETFALNSVSVVARLNATLQSVYARFGIAVATVGAAFHASDDERVHLSDDALMPDKVANVCAMTWMCQPPPYGPNLHPNAAGYAAIAAAIESVLTAPW